MSNPQESRANDGTGVDRPNEDTIIKSRAAGAVTGGVAGATIAGAVTGWLLWHPYSSCSSRHSVSAACIRDAHILYF